MPVTVAEPNLKDAWWTAAHVRLYLHLPSDSAARKFIQRKGVKRCKTARGLTCQKWVDDALDGKGQTNFLRKQEDKSCGSKST